MNLNFTLIYFAYILNLFHYIPNLLASPIIGGQEDSTHILKFHVFIQRNFIVTNRVTAINHCSGTIINIGYILSAAHCFLNLQERLHPKRDRIVVVSGTSEAYHEGIITAVAKIFIPGDYHEHYADISVLKLADDLDLVRFGAMVQVLNIDEGNHALEVFDDEDALVVGYGCDAGAHTRHYLTVRILSRSTSCPEYDYALCAFYFGASSNRCTLSDLGSPIIHGIKVIGVLVDLRTDARGRHLMIFTRTSTFSHFIRTAMDARGLHANMHILDYFDE